jgi:hypothetical protein
MKVIAGIQVPIQMYLYFALFQVWILLYVKVVQVQVNSNHISNTQDRVSIDAGHKFLEADRLLR